MRGENNKINVAITVKIESDIMVQGFDNSQTTNTPSDSFSLSIPVLFRNINTEDADFLKYIPDGFLSEEQKLARQKAIEEENHVAKYSEKVKEPVDIIHNKEALVNRLKQYAKANNREDTDADYRLVEWAKNVKDRTYMKVKITTNGSLGLHRRKKRKKKEHHNGHMPKPYLKRPKRMLHLLFLLITYHKKRVMARVQMKVLYMRGRQLNQRIEQKVKTGV